MNTDHKPTVIIQAAGKNSRFFPLNTETHKGFISVLGAPIVLRTLKDLEHHGFTKVVMVVSKKDIDGKGLSGVLPEYNLNLDISWVLQPTSEGSGHALLLAKDQVDDYAVVVSPYYGNAGQLAQSLWKTRNKQESECVLMGTQVDNPSLYGMFEFATDDPNRVLGIVEKPTENAPSNYKINSIYLLSKGFFDHLANAPIGEYSLETALTTYAREHYISWIENTEKLPSLKFAWNLFDMMQHFFKSSTTTISPEAVIAETAIIDDSSGPVIIETGARVGDYAKIVGPCFLGKKSFVGEYCFVRGGCSIETGATVGANTEVVRSIILERASVHFGYIADSILGQGVKVGAGLITANKRFDRKNVETMLKGKMIEMPNNAHGVIVGAHTHIGISTRTMPGILIGAQNKIIPGSIIYKNTSHEE
ncbi:MAG: hypothetical protein H6773_00255 [Pseudomonadales bacterium]|nr:hypothetical protein [Candidatus Woesebacteria bacterium]MCB9800601.1 hypothetical protein [Pseudomonadales bacterium]